MLLPEIQLAYNTRQHPTIGKTPSIIEKDWNPLLPVDPMKKNLLEIPPIYKSFHDMWKKACDTAARCIPEAKEYNKQRYGNTHNGPDFRTGEDKLPSTNKTHTPKDIVEVEDFPSPVKKIINARMFRINRKDQIQYLVSFKNQKADKDKELAEDSIPDGDL
ncbi:hypothetical protein O181_057765 [Austropuccinia psidii MF-1]|uniref:Uncharacterized protein n=1 Tax=Austropuccinia psidii MF-1 TaxID=1389203 RepID=A0A9Q3HXA0_9BASI|nr:hypothetical protein [Austropuccinia psidii MF-1]